MKIRWSSLFFGPFAPHFQIKLSIHASNFISRFVSMSELELFLLTRVLIPNFNTMDLVKILEKNQKLHIQIVAVTLKVTSCKTMSKKKVKKVKNQDFMNKTNYFLRTLPFSPWAVSATWELLRKYMKNELNTCFQQKFTTGSYGIRIGRAWCSWKACEICSSLV
jgi:hypothetical protein